MVRLTDYLRVISDSLCTRPCFPFHTSFVKMMAFKKLSLVRKDTIRDWEYTVLNVNSFANLPCWSKAINTPDLLIQANQCDIRCSVLIRIPCQFDPVLTMHWMLLILNLFRVWETKSCLLLDCKQRLCFCDVMFTERTQEKKKRK